MQQLLSLLLPFILNNCAAATKTIYRTRDDAEGTMLITMCACDSRGPPERLDT